MAWVELHTWCKSQNFSHTWNELRIIIMQDRGTHMSLLSLLLSFVQCFGLFYSLKLCLKYWCFDWYWCRQNLPFLRDGREVLSTSTWGSCDVYSVCTSVLGSFGWASPILLDRWNRDSLEAIFMDTCWSWNGCWCEQGSWVRIVAIVHHRCAPLNFFHNVHKCLGTIRMVQKCF